MPRGSRYGRCPGCRRQVLRLVHAVTGRVGLIEPAPHRDGVFRVLYDETGRVLLGTYTTAQGAVEGERLHRSHFASCLVDRRRPRRSSPAAAVDDEPVVEEPDCCHACGYRLHAELFHPDVPPICHEYHPSCIPLERLGELHAWQPAPVTS